MRNINKPAAKHLLIILILQVFSISSFAQLPEIFPVPYSMQRSAGRFMIDNTTRILLHTKAGERERMLANLLVAELSDKHRVAVSTVNKNSIGNLINYILIGTLDNPLVSQYCKQKGLETELKKMNKEGYVLSATRNEIVIAGNSHAGVLMGISSLKQLISNGENISVSNVVIRDFPQFTFRGIKLYLPGRKNIPYFKRFIKDFVSLYKFNKIVLELNANMRLDKHPELNMGARELAQYLNANRLDRPLGPNKETSNSSHQDNADGDILEKEEVADIINYMRHFNIEVIPELPSLTHSYYLLAGHRDLAENKHYDFPDTYCPSNENVYKLYFDVLDEYIEVIRPSMIHVGHDEWRIEKDFCERCKGKDYGKLYADDLNKIHKYLSAKGIKTAIWGDHLLESVTGKESADRKTSTGYEYKIPGALTPSQARQSIPKDILIFNWFWDDMNNDKQLSEMKFEQVYGNLRANIADWEKRINIKGLVGGAPSSWAATTETNIGKDQMVDFLGCANMLWSRHLLTYDSLIEVVSARVPKIYSDLGGRLLPSNNPNNKYLPFDISSAFNTPFINSTGKKAVSSKKDATQPIEINKDVTGIIFLHACSREGKNDMSYRMIYNSVETAQLMGWYEVEYQDGFTENIALRYGLNILNWTVRSNAVQEGSNPGSQNKYAYQARAVDCSINDQNITFFEFEWKNPRPGKKIKQVTLRQPDNLQDNAVLLLKMSIAENTAARQARVIERE